MTFKVHYTHRAQPDSEFVDRVWYDADYNTLVVDLHGVVYKYTNVPNNVYSDFVNADSVGTYYRNNIRGRYDGQRLGAVQDLVQQRATPHAPAYHDIKVQDKTEPVRVFANQNVTINSDGSVEAKNLNDSKLQVHRSGGSQKVDPATIGKLSLTKTGPEKEVLYDHTVYFTTSADSHQNERSITLKVRSMDAAIDKLYELAKALTVQIEVKGVLVRFE